MKLVHYEENGWMEQAFVKDNMKSYEAKKGIPHNPPDLRQIDCESLLREINNRLVETGLITMNDLQGGGYNTLQNIVVSTTVKRIANLYKQNGHVKAQPNAETDQNLGGLDG